MSSPSAPTRVEQLPRPAARADMALTLVPAAVAYVVLIVASLTALRWLFLLEIAAVLLTEIGLERRTPFVAWALQDNGIGRVARMLVRGLAAVTLLARTDAHTAAVVLAVVGWTVLTGLAALAHAGSAALRWLRQAPVLSRNIDLSRLTVPRAPRAALLAVRWVPVTDVALLLGVFAAAGPDRSVTGVVVGLAVTLLAGGLGVLIVAHAVQAHRRLAPRPAVPQAIQLAVEVIAPEVLLYHSGDATSTYQLDAWIEPMEASGRSVLVVVRSAAVLRAMRPTTLPVICIGPASTAVGYDFGPRARVALIVGNGRGNIHLFRRHGLAFVFVGHGDSDKATSATPLARIYEQIWVAGPAARERYSRAGVRIAQQALVEIGRPQLAALTARRSSGSPGQQPSPSTVLYAPTWEGWGDEEHVASLGSLGVALVRRLLAEPGVRILYRPHPLTGTRDPSQRRAHREIVGLLKAAGGSVVGPGAATAEPDDLQACLADRGPAAALLARQDRRRAAAESLSGSHHLVIPAGWPDLLDCFAASDLLIADISAVLTDWLATGRPYVVLHAGDSPVADFVATHPSASAATIAGPGLSALDGALDAVLADLRSGADPKRSDRAALAAQLLGPQPVDPIAPMRAALDALLAR